MNRRTFVSVLACLPFIGKLAPRTWRPEPIKLALGQDAFMYSVGEMHRYGEGRYSLAVDLGELDCTTLVVTYVDYKDGVVTLEACRPRGLDAWLHDGTTPLTRDVRR